MTSDDLPTDMMCRRTPLPLHSRYHLLQTTIEIATNRTEVLAASGPACFLPSIDTRGISAMRWEVVGTTGVIAAEWTCGVILETHSLYLSMGPEQWFACDLETGEGAGFIVISDSEATPGRNAERYMQSIAYYVGAWLQGDLEMACRG